MLLFFPIGNAIYILSDGEGEKCVELEGERGSGELRERGSGTQTASRAEKSRRKKYIQ